MQSKPWYRFSWLLVLLLIACTQQAGAQQTAQSTLTPTPTTPPPPPELTFVSVADDVVSPIIVQRFPRRGESLAADGVIELVFDRPMHQDDTAGAFTLQQAAEPPEVVAGDVSWPDERTLRFTPTSALARDATYDVILTQEAIAADNDAPLREPLTFRFQTLGFLEVTQVIPAPGTSDVETNATITVMFNQPVVPLVALAELDNLPEPLTFEPALDGTGEWLNTSIYVFTPAQDLPGGTTYNATVTQGLEDATGHMVLADDFTWSFTTYPPEVISTTPNNGTTLIPIESPIRVTFNQPVDPESAEASFSLSQGGFLGGSAVAGATQVTANTLVFTPTERLNFDTTYNVTLEAGVTSRAGGEGMRQDYSFSFTTVPLPRIVSTWPTDGTRDASPYTDFRIEFNTPINPATVMPHIEMTPPLSPTQVYTYYSPWDNSFSFGFGAQPSTRYQVNLKPGIEDPYGNQTTQDMTVRFTTEALQPSFQLRTLGTVGTYDAALPAKMIVSYVNINTLDLALYRVDATVEALARRSWQWDDYQPQNSNLVRAWTERLEAPANEPAFAVIDLVEDGGSLEPGLYLLNVDSPDTPQQTYYDRQHVLVVGEANLTLKVGERDALAWATDYATGEPVSGVEVVFADHNGSTEIGRATTDSNGVAQITMDTVNRRELVAFTDGEVFGATSEDWSRGISPWEFGLDYVYDLPEFNVHMYTDRPIYRPGQTVYFKGLIRAEDDVEFRLPDVGEVFVTVYDATYTTILEESLAVSPAGSFNQEITLEEGASLGNYTIAVSGPNFYQEYFFQVAAYRPPEFEVTVSPAAPELLRGTDAITVDMFATYLFGGPVANADISWNILAESYRFEPSQLGTYQFTDVDDPYVCLRCWWWYEEPVPQSLLSGSDITDATGSLTVNLEAAELAEILAQGSQRVTVEATVTGPDNQFISGRDSFIVHKGAYYIGLSPQAYITDAGDETAIDLITVDWEAARLAEKELDVQVVRYEYVNTFIEQGVGGYWSYDLKTELVDQFSVTTDDLGEAVARFTPAQGGAYRVIAQDAASLSDEEDMPTSPIRSSIFVWVAGEDSVSWRRENHDRVTLISDKTTYSPGETAEILIPSPFETEHLALVTIERGRIHEHEVIVLDAGGGVYNLPITADHAPNIYVSVALVKGRLAEFDSDAPQLADFKLGILPLDVTTEAQELNITMTPNLAQAEPGEPVTYDLRVTDVTGEPVQAEFSLDLVDKAVLNLQPRPSEAIVAAYYGRRGLGINTASSLVLSVNRFQVELADDLELDAETFATDESARSFDGVGGGAELQATGAPMEMAMEEEAAADVAQAPAAGRQALPEGVEVREDFSDTAYWNPVVVTDPRGEASVTVTLPDNLTTWVMRGIGITGDTLVGEATTELVSTMPLLIRPVTPRFFVVGDRAELAANLNNNTDESMTVDVTLSAEGVTFNEATPPVQTVDIDARSEARVTWNVTVEDVTEADLIFAAESRDGSYADTARPRLTTGPEGTLLVYRYTTPDIVGTAGQLVAGGSRTEVIALPPNVDTRRGELTVQLDPSLAAGMQDSLDYLEHFAYECTEQTVSRFLPNLLTFRALESLGLENAELEAKLPGLVEEGLDKLYTQQKSDGGWGWWPDNQQSNVYVTAYVVFALTKAQQTGVNVSATVLANGQNFLLDRLQSPGQLTATADANQQAFMLYALAEGGRAPADTLEDLFEERELLAHFGRAYLALALHLTDESAYQGNIDTLLSDLNNAAILSATGAHWEENQRDWWAMNTDTRSTAIILDTLARLDPENALIPNVVRWLMVARQAGTWETTQETAWALIALTDWMVETGELDAAYEYNAYLNEADLAEASVTRETVQDSQQLKIAVAELTTDASNLLTVARTDGNGRLYYTAHLEVYQPVEEVEAANRGIIVQRRYTLQSCLEESQRTGGARICGDAVEAPLGAVVRVDLTIIAPNDLYYLVVEDPLPAGAEAIDTGLATTSLLAIDPTLSPVSTATDGFAGRGYWWWWRWYSRSELRDDKVVLFADVLPKGTYEYSYSFRTTLPGDYQVLPTVAREFYFPEVFGRSEGRLLSIGR